MDCRICGNTQNNKLYKIRERQINNGDIFQYLYCNQCGTLQLIDKIENVSNFYKDDYYSFHLRNTKKKLPPILMKGCMLFVLHNPFLLPAVLENFMREKAGSLMFLYKTKLKLNSKILDVGGGNGKWLDLLSQCGFTDLVCIDLFCKKTPFSSIDFKQCDIVELDSATQYDFIMFNHSFEHMPDPERILTKVKNLLSIDGICLIRIPVCECEVWDKYQEDWYQIDAPRHYYLYTERAMRNLCAKFDLEIFRVVYDSGVRQFVISEYYKKTKLSLKEIEDKIVKYDLKQFRKKVKWVNKLKKGDQAAFYIRHKK